MSKTTLDKATGLGSGSGSSKRSSARKSVLSKAMRVVDSETRRAVRQRRLAALEADNYLDEVAEEGADDDHSEDDRDAPANGARRQGEADDSRKRKRKGAKTNAGISKWVTMKVKSLQRVLDEAGLGEDYVHRHLQQHLELQRHPGGRVTGVSFGGTTPEANYVTVCAGPSALPKRKFCSVCGFFGPYGCGRCGSRLCSARCSSSHAETRCLKFSL